MSKIKNWGLDQYGAELFEQQQFGTSGVEGVKENDDDDDDLCSKYNFSTQPPEDDEDYIDMGAAQLQFYSSLVDLLGRCAPEAEAIKAGRSDSLRARAILRSLVSLEDLEGALALRFILPVKKTEQVRSINQSITCAPWFFYDFGAI